MKKIVFLQAAENEMLATAEYYESKATGLGTNFLSTIQQSLEGIATNPKAAPVIRDNIRRRIVHRFPYGVLYKIDRYKIVVVAVMHLRRKPDYWQQRI